MSHEKKVIVRKLRFDELAYSFDLIKITLDTRYGVFNITQENIGVVLDLNVSGRSFQAKLNFKSLVRRTRKFIEAFKAIL
ncbi:hypothetical protein Ahy_B06g081639 [Arachis hypogaea]|uniref:Uncharacterized protein n=1 Tax=Arachis hypogaea TaxID=3818 RepID=A0A444YLH5_ARAHY|nr:hypothetical protein Ahy_B06g081639 [Arachis hypogaea]